MVQPSSAPLVFSFHFLQPITIAGHIIGPENILKVADAWGPENLLPPTTSFEASKLIILFLVLFFI